MATTAQQYPVRAYLYSYILMSIIFTVFVSAVTHNLFFGIGIAMFAVLIYFPVRLLVMVIEGNESKNTEND